MAKQVTNKAAVNTDKTITLSQGSSFKFPRAITTIRTENTAGVMASLIRHYDPFQRWQDNDLARKVA